MGLIWAGAQGTHSVSEFCSLEAQRAIEQAQLEAARRGAATVTVKDLLAGLTWEEGTRADRIANLKPNAVYLRWLLGLPALPASNLVVQNAQIDFDHSARMALAFAQAEAERDDSRSIHSDHLLRGLLRFPNVAHFALLKTEVNLQSARNASKKDREEFFLKAGPRLEVYQYKVRKYMAHWAPSLLGIACYLYILIQGLEISQAPVLK